MLEKIAIALYSEDALREPPHIPGMDGWKMARKDVRDHYMRTARTCIEAMREPTPGMIYACGTCFADYEGNKSIWQTMIDEALE